MAAGGGGHDRLFLLHQSGPYVTSEPSGQQYGRKAGCRASEDSLEPIRTKSPALFSHHPNLGDTESCRRGLGPLSPLPARAQDSEELTGLQAHRPGASWTREAVVPGTPSAVATVGAADLPPHSCTFLRGRPHPAPLREGRSRNASSTTDQGRAVQWSVLSRHREGPVRGRGRDVRGCETRE